MHEAHCPSPLFLLTADGVPVGLSIDSPESPPAGGRRPATGAPIAGPGMLFS